MAPLAAQPTAYPEVNALLKTLQTGIEAILGAQFTGIYLHGSLAGGEFDPGRSDIDFMVCTDGLLSGEVITALAGMHASIAASQLPWATNHEGSYIPQQALRRYDPGDCVHPAVEVDGSFGLARHGSDWVIQRHIIRERGIVLAGPDPRSLIAPVSPQELQDATRALLRERWAPQLADPLGLQSSEYQAYAILTMCRTLYTLRYGDVASKPQAGRWARERLGGRWAELIGAALGWRRGVTLDRLDETLAFVRFALQLAEVSTP